LWLALKSELKVALKTLAVAWLAFTVLLVLVCLFDSPDLHGVQDVAAMLTFGVVICAFYTFWPALAVSACRMVHRLLGWGAYVGAFVALGGVLSSLVLFRHVFASLVLDIFRNASMSGPCGAHGGGAAGVVIALFCLAAAVAGSPGSWLALVELFLALGGAILLGALPGMLIWLVLIARKLAKLAKQGVSR
jgi:hypothetical protein